MEGGALDHKTTAHEDVDYLEIFQGMIDKEVKSYIMLLLEAVMGGSGTRDCETPRSVKESRRWREINDPGRDRA